MTSVDVNDVLKRTQSTANGSTTDFSFSFQVNATSEIKVYEDSTLKTEGTHYDVVNSSGSVGLNTNGTGVVKFKTSPSDYTPANGKVITILSVMSLARSSVYSSGGNITAQSLETDFDSLHRIVGDFREVKSRTLIAPEYSATTIDMTIPSKASRLGKILSFNASTGNPEVTFTVADGLTLASVSADIATLADIEDGTDATNAIQTVASNASNVNTVAGISSNVTTVAGIQANVTTVAGKASLITSDFAADMALIDSTFVTKMNLVTSDFVSDVNTLATSDIISDINLLATTDVISDLNTLATSDIVSDLNTLATSDIVSDINTLATSDIVSDLNTLATSDIVSDINTLATSDIVADLALLATSDFVSDLNTMATSTNVSDLNTVAGAVTNVNNVGGSIANVNTVASNLSGVNSFADRYRVASSAPSSSLDVGDLYFDTTANELKVYKSSGWAAAGSTVNGTSARFHYDISGTPTTVTGADAAGNTLAYDAGFIDVYVNGVRMAPEDITITSGTSVVFAVALADGDDVDIVAFGTFSVANIVSTGALNSGSITSGFGNIDTGSSTITTTGAITGGSLAVNGDATITSTDDGTSTDPDLILYRNSASPAVNDYLGIIKFLGRNDASEDVVYARIQSQIRDETDGTEDGSMWFSVMKDGTLTNILELKGNGKTFFNNSNVQLSTGVNLFFEGATANDFETQLTVTDPTADRTITLPDATGTVALQNASIDMNGTELILDADADTSITADTDDQIDFKVGGSDKMTLTSAGNLQFGSASDFTGTDDTLQLGSGAFKIFHNGGGGNSVACMLSTANSMQIFTDVVRFTSADNTESLFGADKDGAFFAKFNNATSIATTAGGIASYGTNDIIKTDGFIKCSNTFAFHGSTDNYSNVDGQNFHELNSSAGNEFIVMMKNTNSGTTQHGLYLDHASGNTDNTSSTFIQAVNTAARFKVLGDGDVQNHDNSYGSISDERIKQDITDANSQWNDIKAIKIRNYKKKDDIRDYGDKAWSQIGVVAQELETVSPYLIKENSPSKSDILSSSEFGTLYTSDDAETKAVLYKDGDTIPEGKKVGDVKTPASKVVGDIKEEKNTVKSVKYSVLYMKAIKALQEAMTRIETLEAKVKTLEEA